MEQMIDPVTHAKLEKIMSEAEEECCSSNTMSITEALGKAEVLRIILPFTKRADAVMGKCMTHMLDKLLEGMRGE